MNRLASSLLFATLVALVGARAIALARTPPFELAIVPRERTQVEVTGLAVERRARRAVVRVEARSARPGHIEVGPFLLSPATSLVLQDVTVAIIESGASATVSGRTGEIKGRSLVVRGAQVRRGAAVERHHAVIVDLDAGDVRGD